MSQEAKYLGDGVYVQRDGEDVVLTTGTHVREDADGVVVLDPEVVSALVRWLTPPSITILTDAFTKDQLAAIDLMIEAVVPPGTPRELLGLLPVGPERPAWERDAVLSRAAAPTPAPYVTPNAHACKPVARGGHHCNECGAPATHEDVSANGYATGPCCGALDHCVPAAVAAGDVDAKGWTKRPLKPDAREGVNRSVPGVRAQARTEAREGEGEEGEEAVKLEEAKTRVRDLIDTNGIGGRGTELLSAHGTDALETLLRALGEPSDEDREAAGWFRAEANRADETAQLTGVHSYTARAARYRRAAEALLRSPAAIRRAAFEEAAKVVTGYAGLSDEAEHIAKAIRALAEGLPVDQDNRDRGDDPKPLTEAFLLAAFGKPCARCGRRWGQHPEHWNTHPPVECMTWVDPDEAPRGL